MKVMKVRRKNMMLSHDEKGKRLDTVATMGYSPVEGIDKAVA